jgi:hypothetical protein
MRENGQCVRVQMDDAARVQLLLQEYGHFAEDAEPSASCWPACVEVRGARRWRAGRRLARAGHTAEVFAALMQQHYDPLYERSMRRSYRELDRHGGWTCPMRGRQRWLRQPLSHLIRLRPERDRSTDPPDRPIRPPDDTLPRTRAIAPLPAAPGRCRAALAWLARGWRDLLRCPCPGCCTAWRGAFGSRCSWVAHRFWLLAGAFSGFLLVAPLVATGLYAVSRALQRGQRPTLGTALRAWRPTTHGWCLRPAAGAGRHRLGADLGIADHRFAPQPVNEPGRLPAHRGGADDSPGCSRPGWCWAACWPRRCSPPAWSRSRCCWSAHRRAGRRADQLARGDGAPAAMALWAALLMGSPCRHGHGAARPGGGRALAGPRQLARLPRPGGRCRRCREDALTGTSAMFGYTEEQIAQFGLTFGVSAFMLYMVFIIFQLARESKAGRFGTFVLFLALGFGLRGLRGQGRDQVLHRRRSNSRSTSSSSTLASSGLSGPPCGVPSNLWLCTPCAKMPACR